LGELSKRTIEEALTDARLDLTAVDKTRVGVCFATSVGSSYPFMKWIKAKQHGDPGSDLLLLTTPTIAGDIAKHFKIKGPISTISTACAAGTNSIGRAFDFISSNKADYMIAGGADIFTELTYSGFNCLQALSENSCTPFDRERDGLNLGDAGAFVIMESLESARRRNARIYGEIKGYAILNEAYHPTAPCPDGSFALAAMKKALAQGNINIEDVDYINAHGTATPANDIMELKAIRNLVGDNAVYVSSTKSMTGHTLGAAGSIELVITALAMHEGFIPPTINTKTMEEVEDNICLVKDAALEKSYDTAISNSFGFAGNMASIVIQKLKS
jgi:3-oxoacyl-[acyl-carrier-protein] synthase II